MDEHKTQKALQWIVSLLNRHQVPYQLIGGVAARAYGARRPVVDIDLYIPMEKAQAAIDEMRPYLIREPLPHHSTFWDLTYLVLDYEGVYIEIGDSSSNPHIFNQRDQRWDPQVIDYSASHKAALFGIEVDVMPRSELASYKTKLDRKVDHVDLREMDPGYQETGDSDYSELSPYVSLVLHMDAFNERLCETDLMELQGEGFRFTSMEELGNDEAAQRKLYLLNDTTCMEMPGSSGEHAWDTFEDFRREVCLMDWYQPGGQIIAIDTLTGSWAAMSAITRFSGSGNTWNLHTGVDRAYHGRDLETAVLGLAARYARDVLKADCVLADETIQNTAMIAVYHRLGYSKR